MKILTNKNVIITAKARPQQYFSQPLINTIARNYIRPLVMDLILKYTPKAKQSNKSYAEVLTDIILNNEPLELSYGDLLAYDVLRSTTRLTEVDNATIQPNKENTGLTFTFRIDRGRKLIVFDVFFEIILNIEH